MNCVDCRKFLGWHAAIRGKNRCKKCQAKFDKMAVEEFGLKIVYVNKPIEVNVSEILPGWEVEAA